MRHLAYIVFLLSFTAWAQKPSEKQAHSLFARKSYVKAAQMYEQLKPTQTVLANMGDAYYYNGRSNEAVRAYGQLFFSFKDSLDPEYSFRYAHALMGAGDYDKADVIMGEYVKFPVSTLKFMANLANNVPYHYTIQPMAKNITNGDFGMAFFGEKVAFASLRNSERPVYNWNERPYLDLYSAVVSDKGMLTRIEPFPESINTKTHESSPTFSPDGKIMYFNRTNDKRVEVGDEKFASVKIFRAEFVGGDWTNITVMPFSSDTYSTEHPMLTRDGKRLYFSSDMPGGQGSFDIYFVDINDDGSVSAVQNLGNTINTKHREQFPYISDDGNVLYFASDGHQGLGGLDIFMSRAYDGQFAKPLNLGQTINSGMDDFGYIVDEKRNKGYLSSNRKGGIDNLYSFTREENASGYFVEGDVRDKNTREALPGSTVTLVEEDTGKLIGQIVVGSNAEYVFATEPNKRYRITAVRDFYIPHSEVFKTNEEGKLRYTIELFMECYDDAEEIITRRQDGRVQIVLENIYFELDKWSITPEAGRVLNTLVDILKKYPEMEIELGAHTDSRASNMYNLRLSNRRAAAALDYLVANGIEKWRLKSRGYGETVPLINCGNGCTEQQHSINRRCEFIITR